jgi:hypothetical protein
MFSLQPPRYISTLLIRVADEQDRSLANVRSSSKSRREFKALAHTAEWCGVPLPTMNPFRARVNGVAYGTALRTAAGVWATRTIAARGVQAREIFAMRSAIRLRPPIGAVTCLRSVACSWPNGHATAAPQGPRTYTRSLRCEEAVAIAIIGPARRTALVLGWALERADAILRQWPAAALSLLVLAIVLGAAMLTGR